MRMGLDNAAQLIIEYRYWILVPLAFIEGPIIAFVAGTLASLGYFNVYALGVFFFARDMIMDGVYYGIGYFGGRTAFARNILKKIGVERDHLDDVRTLWERHAGKTMFLGKLSYGIASSFIVVAGMVKMPLGTFFGWGAVVAVVEWGGLLILGYFFGASIGSNGTHLIENIGYAIGGVTLAASAYYLITFYIGRRMKKRAHEHGM